MNNNLWKHSRNFLLRLYLRKLAFSIIDYYHFPSTFLAHYNLWVFFLPTSSIYNRTYSSTSWQSLALSTTLTSKFRIHSFSFCLFCCLTCIPTIDFLFLFKNLFIIWVCTYNLVYIWHRILQVLEEAIRRLQIPWNWTKNSYQQHNVDSSKRALVLWERTKYA